MLWAPAAFAQSPAQPAATPKVAATPGATTPTPPAPDQAAPTPQGDGESTLSRLIPDAAVARPGDWARSAAAPPAVAPAPLAEVAGPPAAVSASGAGSAPISPSSPLADLPGFLVDWPDMSAPVAPLAALPPDGESTAPAPSLTILTVDLPPGQPHERSTSERLDRLAAGRVVLAWHVAGQAIPERAELESRFRALSALQAMPGKEAENLPQLAVRAAADRAVLQQLLRTYGYYDAEANQTLAGGLWPVGAGGLGPAGAGGLGPAGAGGLGPVGAGGIGPSGVVAGAPPAHAAEGKGGPLVRFDIVPGTRYRFGTIDLGPLATLGPAYLPLRKHFAIFPGDPLHLDAIPAQTAALDTALGEAGYVFAHIDPPALTVDHLREEGDLTLPVQPGGIYRFGQIVSTNEHFLSGRHLASIARFKPGQPYKRSAVDDLRRAILATGLVSSLTVTPREVSAPVAPVPAAGTSPANSPDAAPATIPGVVALDVAMTPAPARTVSGAIGYDTAQGFRLEAGWEHRNLFPPEGSLRLRGVAGTNEQLAGVTLRRANFHGRDRVLTFDLYADNATLPAYAARAVDFSATYERQTTLLFQKPWSYSLGLEAEASLEREGVPSGITTGRTAYVTLAAPLRATWDRSNDFLDPSRGYRIGLRVSPELSQARGVASTYARIQLDASGYQPLMSGVVLATRLRLGTLPGAALEDVAPSRRFYAGGGGSIRGYGFELVGPRNSLNEPEGARSLYEVSLEARVNTGLMHNALALVPFLDSGGAGTGTVPNFKDMRYGAGLGLRYQTGFGPVRLDVGTPLNPRPGDSRIGVYVTLGQAF